MEKKSPIAVCSGREGRKIVSFSKSFLLKFPIAPFPPETLRLMKLKYQVELIEAFINSDCEDVISNMKPPWTVYLSIPLINACLPTKRLEPFAAVIKMSFSCTNSILIDFSSTNISSSCNTKVSSSIFDERRTLTPESLISDGL
ncbi:hypothetical protein D8826_09195 [Streptococcus intermedius]|nr:hypothetical protein D8826_09195 [Streptococcus intermedius]